VLVRPLELKRKADGLELRAVVAGDRPGDEIPGTEAAAAPVPQSRRAGERFDISMTAVGALRRVRILFFGDDDEREQ